MQLLNKLVTPINESINIELLDTHDNISNK